MQNFEEIKTRRVNVNLADDVIDWYKYNSRRMGMSMSQLMSFILTNYYDKRIEAEALKNVNHTVCDEKIRNENAEMLNLINKLIEGMKDE